MTTKGKKKENRKGGKQVPRQLRQANSFSISEPFSNHDDQAKEVKHTSGHKLENAIPIHSPTKDGKEKSKAELGKNPLSSIGHVGQVPGRKSQQEVIFQNEIARLGRIDENIFRRSALDLDVEDRMGAYQLFEQQGEAEMEERRRARRTVPEILQEEDPVLTSHAYEGRWQNGESDLDVFSFPNGIEIHIHFKHKTKQIRKAHTRGLATIDLFQSNVAAGARGIGGWQGQVLQKCCKKIGT